MRRLVATLVLVLLAASWWRPAHSHAMPHQAHPADGARLAAPPAEVDLRFNEPVRLARLRLLTADDPELDLTAAAQVTGTRVTAPLPDLAESAYLIDWRAVSLDGHVIGGTLSFAVGAGSAALHLDARAEEPARWPLLLTRLALYLGALVAAGASLYRLGVTAPVGRTTRFERRLAVLAAGVGVIGLLGHLWLQARALGGGADPSAWLALLGGAKGTATAALITGLLLIGASGGFGRPAVPAVGAGLVVLGFAASGHPVALGPAWLLGPLVAVHVGVAAFWLGALAPLYRVAAGPPTVAAPVLDRFSRLALIAVPLLAVAGVLLAWMLVGTAAALVTTAYGGWLLAKVGLLVGLLALAALNRARLTPRLRAGDARAGHHLRRSIAAELVLGIGVLVATAGLTGGAPPVLGHADHRAPEPSRPAPQTAPLDPGGAQVHLVPDPTVPHAFELHLLQANGRPLEPVGVTVRLSLPGRDLAGLERRLDPVRPGLYRLDVPELAMGGAWQLDLDVLVTDFAKARAVFALGTTKGP